MRYPTRGYQRDSPSTLLLRRPQEIPLPMEKPQTWISRLTRKVISAARCDRFPKRPGMGTSGAGADSSIGSNEQQHTDAGARVRDRGANRQAAREDSRPVCRAHRSAPAGMPEVIALPAGTRIWLAAGMTGMRCGFSLTKEALRSRKPAGSSI
jgi:hypothetical protein